jgi:twitching motility protein PilT
MARLDSVIEKLLREAGYNLTFETGASAVLHSASGEVVVVRQKLTAQQIVGAFGEILPNELREGFPSEGMTSFHYRSPGGVVTVHFNNEGGKLSVKVLPGEEALDGGMQLASAAEMMDMAASASGFGSSTPAPAKPAGRPAPPAPAPPPAAARPAAPAPSPRGGDPAAYMASLLNYMMDRGASDLHLSCGNVPMIRVDGDIIPLEDQPVLEPEKVKAMIWSIAPERNQKQWEEMRDTDYAHETPRARFRCNIFSDRKGIGTVMRQIPNNIRSAEDLGLSKSILDLCFLTKGLVLVTGPTGSGKSTTLAAMVDFINRNREDHIITIEDPIEFVHQNRKCLVNQREVGVHTNSFKQALRAALREDPDIVLVGEMRDLETIAIAIETAETGHLVFGTLHTTTAPSTVDRIIDQFPADRQAQIRTAWSESLKGVIAQTLCKKIGGGRAAALEVLLGTGSVANLIREGKTFQLPSIMQTGKGVGMVTLNDALFELVKKGWVDPTEAYMKSVAKSDMKNVLERGGFKVDLPAA